MSCTIRAMEPRDSSAGAGLIRQLTGQPFSAADMQNRLDWVQNSPVDWLYVAEVDGQVYGLLGFRLRERIEHLSRHGEISVIVTHADARRQGVGRAMMAFAEQLAREHGCIGMFLVSGFGRKDEAHRFYEQLGYAATGFRFMKLFEC